MTWTLPEPMLSSPVPEPRLCPRLGRRAGVGRLPGTPDVPFAGGDQDVGGKGAAFVPSASTPFQPGPSPRSVARLAAAAG